MSDKHEHADLWFSNTGGPAGAMPFGFPPLGFPPAPPVMPGAFGVFNGVHDDGFGAMFPGQ